MAELRSDGGALRFALALVARESDPGPPGGGAQGAASRGRLLVTAGIEYLDRRDGEWWPVVRLPPARVPVEAIERLLGDQAALLDGSSSGFAWRPDDEAALALQLGLAPNGAVVEIGLDLGPFLAEWGGAPVRRDAELALFRLRAGQADLVRFSDALARELEVLRR